MLREPVLHRPLTEYQLAHSGRLLSVSVAAPGLTPARFLAHAAGHERF